MSTQLCPTCDQTLNHAGPCDPPWCPRLASKQQPTPRKNNSAAHSDMVADIRLALGQEPDCVGWPMQPGGIADSTGRPMRCGPTGMTDLIYVVRMRVFVLPQTPLQRSTRFDLGRLMGIEVKTGSGKLSAEQKMWHALVRRFGGFACEVRSVDDARAALSRARLGMNS